MMLTVAPGRRPNSALVLEARIRISCTASGLGGEFISLRQISLLKPPSSREVSVVGLPPCMLKVLLLRS